MEYSTAQNTENLPDVLVEHVDFSNSACYWIQTFGLLSLLPKKNRPLKRIERCAWVNCTKIVTRQSNDLVFDVDNPKTVIFTDADVSHGDIFYSE